MSSHSLQDFQHKINNTAMYVSIIISIITMGTDYLIPLYILILTVDLIRNNNSNGWIEHYLRGWKIVCNLMFSAESDFWEIMRK